MQKNDTFRQRLSHRNHIALYDYWRAKSPPTVLPGRQHIDPLDIPRLLSSIALISVVREPGTEPRFRYRLTGTTIVGHAGRDPTGKFFEDLYEGDYLASAHEVYRGIVKSRAPFVSSRYFLADKKHVTYERLILPLATDGKTVDMLIFMPVFHDSPDPAHPSG